MEPNGSQLLDWIVREFSESLDGLIGTCLLFSRIIIFHITEDDLTARKLELERHVDQLVQLVPNLLVALRGRE